MVFITFMPSHHGRNIDYESSIKDSILILWPIDGNPPGA